MSNQRFPKGDLYKILEVSSDATFVEIKQSYRKLILKHHPDKSGSKLGNHEKFTAVHAAYEILSDPVKRLDYDQHRSKEATGNESKQQKPAPKHRGSQGQYKETSRDSERSSTRSSKLKEMDWITEHFKRIERFIDFWLERMSEVKYSAMLLEGKCRNVYYLSHDDVIKDLVKDCVNVISRFRDAIISLDNDVYFRSGTSREEDAAITYRYTLFPKIMQEMDMMLYDVEEIFYDLENKAEDRQSLIESLEGALRAWREIGKSF